MMVTEEQIRKYLLNERLYETRKAPGICERKNLVFAASKLLPLLWDGALGYGNPRREVTTIFHTFSGVLVFFMRCLKSGEIVRKIPRVFPG